MNIYHVCANPEQTSLQEFVVSWDRALEADMERVAARVAAIADLRFLGLTGPTCSGKTANWI